MKPEEFINIAIKAGYEYEEYASHYCIRQNMGISITVTIPKVQQLVSPLVAKAKVILGL